MQHYPNAAKKINKLKKKIRQDLKKYLYQVIQPQQIFAEMIPITSCRAANQSEFDFLHSDCI